MKRWSSYMMVAGIACLSGCGFPPIGSPPTGSDPGDSSTVPDSPDSTTDAPDSTSDTPDTTDAGGDDGSLMAVAMPQFGDGPDVLLDGGLDSPAFLDGSASSSQDGGAIVTWEWLVNGIRAANGSQISIDGFPVGVTTVTLLVTDETGVQDTAEINIINPGFRPGLWQGTTDQGYPVEFTIDDDMSLVAMSFGYEFDGQNLLNSTPCTFTEPQQDCGACTTSAQRCTFSATWGTENEFAAAGNCVETDPPPYEQATGTASAAPTSNCAGATNGITWTASWASE